MLATSLDGLAFEWHGTVLDVGEGWDRYQAWLNSIVPTGTVRRRRVHRGLFNRRRLHSTLGYRTPFEALTNPRTAAAA